MLIPIKYNIKNILIRWRTTVSTLGAISLVTAVFILVLSLYQGLKEFYSGTGDPRNLIILRKGATAEMNSQVPLDSYNIIKYLEGIAKDAEGNPVLSAEILTVIALERATFEGNANVQLRGVGKSALELRPQVKITEGRMFTPGKHEVIVSKTIAGRFRNLAIGQTFSRIRNEWTITGIFDGQKSAYDSEIWCDADELRNALKRENYSILLLRTDTKDGENKFMDALSKDKRLTMTAKSEIAYFDELVSFFKPVRLLGVSLAFVMAIGACFAAMNTMYTMIHHRTRDIGTLRVLGFRRLHILISFLIESVVISLLAGCIGILIAMPMNGFATGTANFKTFSEVVFEFRITGGIMINALIFAVTIGFLGGLIPSFSAARKPILQALKSS